MKARLNIFGLVFGVCLFSFQTISQTSLINPLQSNNFIADYTLPDGTVRVIGSEHGRNRELFFVDQLTDGTVTEPVFFPETFGELEFNFAGVDALVLPLKNGDVMLGINQSDCDYSPWSSLARFDKDGNVKWAISVEEHGFYSSIIKLTLVDSNVVCIISDEADTLFVTTEGITVAADPLYAICDSVMITTTGFIASRENTIYLLNESFDLVDSLVLDARVTAMTTAGDSLIFISTESFLVVLDGSMEVKVFSAAYSSFDMLAISSQGLWGAYREGNIWEWDNQLSIQDTHMMNSFIKLRGIRSAGEKIVLSGNHIGALASSIFFHTAPGVHFSFTIRKDIAIDTVTIQQPIFYEFDLNGFPWGFNIPYSNTIASVRNTGQNAIEDLVLAYKVGSGCFFCEPFEITWEYNDVNLSPGESMDLDLGDFEALCIVRGPSFFCLALYPADNLPEINSDNNQHCQIVDAFFVSTVQINQPKIKIYPNPAVDFIRIEMEESFITEVQGFLYDVQGRVVEPFTLNQSMTDVAVSHLQAGIYFLSLEIKERPGWWSKIIVTR